MGYFKSKNKTECYGCEACSQVCPHSAISMVADGEGFKYPEINAQLCIGCGACERVCPYDHSPKKNSGERYVFGGHHKDAEILFESTSGGAFSAIVDAFCDENYVIFGVASEGLRVYHDYITDKSELGKFRKSKYSQSDIGDTYVNVKRFLGDGRKVLFSGTPCQTAGLLTYLRSCDTSKLLCVEVVCEGVPSPLYMEKYDASMKERYGVGIASLDYRYKGKSCFSNGKWDFQQMRTELGAHDASPSRIIVRDRWFNPFWSVWLKHLMSRPSCYECKFATNDRLADITLGDLWGVHLYCPELYDKNRGASLAVCNTQKGKAVWALAEDSMCGHGLSFDDALKYQSPMRKHISGNPERESFMEDLKNPCKSFEEINKRWATPPSCKLLWQKYVWGNRQKVWLWNLTHKNK